MTPASSHGILLLDKPPGVSSFAALYPVKRVFGGKKGAKIGHAGTLDPAASGLLVLGVGAGTRLLEFLEGLPKRYRFQAHLGVTTDTCDLEGEALERRDASGVTRAAVEAALAAFTGEIMQTPPAYSAIKIDGRRAYDLARAGEEVALAPRRVRIERLVVTGFEPGLVTLEVDCSKGTYVRSLARDLGAALGCGAAADSIRRLAIGPFRVDDAVTPPASRDDDEAWRATLAAALIPAARAAAHLPALRLKAPWVVGLRNGNPVPAAGYEVPEAAAPRDAGGPRFKDGDAGYAVFAPGGELLAIASLDSLGSLRPRKVFPAV